MSALTRQLVCLGTQISEKLDEVIAALGGPAPIDYTALLNDIIAELQDIDANTDTVEASLTSIDTSNAAIEVNTGQTVTELQSILTEVQAVNANTDNVETLLQDIITELQLPDPEPSQAIVMDSSCITVDGGTAEFATPVVIFNQITGLFTSKTWFDSVGDEITGVVVETDPCDCECEPCPEGPPPTITLVAPNQHAIFDNTNGDALTVTITGTGFDPTSTAAFTPVVGSVLGSLLLNVISTTYVSPTELTVSLNSGSVDPFVNGITYDVSVTAATGTATAPAAFDTFQIL